MCNVPPKRSRAPSHETSRVLVVRPWTNSEMKSTNVIDAYFKTQVIHANNMQIAARKKTFLPDTNLLRLDTRSADER